jgi:hypothetical protein
MLFGTRFAEDESKEGNMKIPNARQRKRLNQCLYQPVFGMLHAVFS